MTEEQLQEITDRYSDTYGVAGLAHRDILTLLAEIQRLRQLALRACDNWEANVSQREVLAACQGLREEITGD